MNEPARSPITRFVPERMRSDQGRNVSVMLAAFATIAAVTYFWLRGRRHVAVVNS